MVVVLISRMLPSVKMESNRCEAVDEGVLRPWEMCTRNDLFSFDLEFVSVWIRFA